MAIAIGEAFGRISHYYPRMGVGIIELTEGELNLGQVVHINGKHTDFSQPVDSIQIDHQNVMHADRGTTIGIKVKDRVRENDQVAVAR
ncbi:MAG: translation elongation factor-like protein [Candidatus Binatia bacterium]